MMRLEQAQPATSPAASRRSATAACAPHFTRRVAKHHGLGISIKRQGREPLETTKTFSEGAKRTSPTHQFGNEAQCSAFSKLPPKNARASRPDRSARGTRGGCRTAGRHPRRHAKSNLFAARRRPVRVPRDRRRSPSRPARRARSTRRAWPRSRAQYFEPATRAEVGAMLTADPDTLTAHDIASGATWADRDRDSDRGGSRQRYEQTRQ